MSVKITSSHEGHRKRLKSRFLKSGLDGFEDHNVLELLLFYAIPYKDTNELAHKIINHFGTMERVFDADIKELCQIDGVGENVATLIKLVPQISQYYLRLKQQKRERFKTVDEIAEFLRDQYVFDDREAFSILCLDSQCGFLGYEKMQAGTANLSEVSIVKAIEIAFRYNATCVVIAHNHPSGGLKPSDNDITTTRRICDAFSAVHIDVKDHIIVTKTDYTSMINSKQYESMFINKSRL